MDDELASVWLSGEMWERDALYLVVLITFVEEGHPCAGNYRNQRYQQHGFKRSIATIRRKT